MVDRRPLGQGRLYRIGMRQVDADAARLRADAGSDAGSAATIAAADGDQAAERMGRLGDGLADS